jgi:hypothetical protein
MVWMVRNGMVVNVWVVVVMVMMVLHALWWGWFPSTAHDNHITTAAIVLVYVFFCWWRLPAAWRSTAKRQAN